MVKKIFIAVIIIVAVVVLSARLGMFVGKNEDLVDYAKDRANDKREQEFLKTLDVMDTEIPGEFPSYLVYENSYKRAVNPRTGEDEGVVVILLTKDKPDMVQKYYSETLIDRGYWEVREPTSIKNIRGTYDINSQYSSETGKVYVVVGEWSDYTAIGLTYYPEELK